MRMRGDLMVRRILSPWIATVLVTASCRDGALCLTLDPEREPDRTVSVCSEHFERTKDPRAAVAVVTAYEARKDDAAIVTWAEHVGDLPGAARVWRRACKAHERRG